MSAARDAAREAADVLADYLALAAEREGVPVAELLAAAVQVLAKREPAAAVSSHVAAELLESGSARVAGPWEWDDELARSGDDTCERQAVVDGRTRPVAQIYLVREWLPDEDDECVLRWRAGVRADASPGGWLELGVHDTPEAAAAACDEALRPRGWVLRGPAEPPRHW